MCLPDRSRSAMPRLGPARLFRFLISADHYHRGLAEAKRLRFWRLYANPHRIARGQVYPVQRALNIGQSGGRNGSDERRIGLHAEADAVHHAVVFHVGPGENVDIGVHSRLDSVELRLTKVRDGPPSARIDQSKDLLASVG